MPRFTFSPAAFLLATALGMSSAYAAPTALTSPADSALPPFSMADLDGTLKGFTIDLAAALSRQLGRPINIDSVQWSAALPGLSSGKFDLLLPPVNVTPERASMLLFSEPYLENDFMFLTRKNAPEVTELSALKGKTIATNKGSSFEAWAKSKAQEFDFKVDVYGSGADAIQAVQSGRAFATITSLQTASWLGANNPTLKTSYRIRTGNVAAIAFRKDQPQLQLEVSNALKCLKRSGELLALYTKWTGLTPEADSPTVVEYQGVGVNGFEGYTPDTPAPNCR
ncbi:transporter substrate-binding domain-containing protein [Lampropedia puyangensis]|uniref:Transporter substrate-binding domain-containing protein n=1 Tax=Lampropedia puyangensis TaxID=1330072 RepID=A0A4S8EP33_9BURK|nr:transporter substrate-binding domain-containing protein [Lampropedia puyangensis]THT95958.1 transporter substrate-binding domain-containing protein [Lampropedia puyangensis]